MKVLRFWLNSAYHIIRVHEAAICGMAAQCARHIRMGITRITAKEQTLHAIAVQTEKAKETALAIEGATKEMKGLIDRYKDAEAKRLNACMNYDMTELRFTKYRTGTKAEVDIARSAANAAAKEWSGLRSELWDMSRVLPELALTLPQLSLFHGTVASDCVVYRSFDTDYHSHKRLDSSGNHKVFEAVDKSSGLTCVLKEFGSVNSDERKRLIRQVCCSRSFITSLHSQLWL